MADGYYYVNLEDGARLESYNQTLAPRHDDTGTSGQVLPAGEKVVRNVVKTMQELRGPAREAAMMDIAKRIKISIVGEQCTLDSLFRASIAAKAAPAIHQVIADECIRLGVGRRDYRKVVVPLFNRIRDAIKWKDVKGARFCPKWGQMKTEVYDKKMCNGPNKTLKIFRPDWSSGKAGCVWADVSMYLAEREAVEIYREGGDVRRTSGRSVGAGEACRMGGDMREDYIVILDLRTFYTRMWGIVFR